MILSCTGHRPYKISAAIRAPYTYNTYHQIFALVQTHLLIHKPAKLISGLALGFDTICAEAALRLEIPLIAAIPYPDQSEAWSSSDKQTWRNLRDGAEQVHIISPSYMRGVMQARNIWMVNQSDSLLSFYAGGVGGTWNTMVYATSQSKPCTNLWHSFAQPEATPCP